jgi:hypothetical protein
VRDAVLVAVAVEGIGDDVHVAPRATSSAWRSRVRRPSLDPEVLSRDLDRALDHPNHVDRVLRLPGSLNLPDKRKRVRGQQPVRAFVLFKSGERHDWRTIETEIADLERSPPAHAVALTAPRAKAKRTDELPFDGIGLPPWPTEEQVTALLEDYPDIASVWHQTCPPPPDGTPSAWDMKLAGALRRRGVDREAAGSFLRAYRAEHEPEKQKHDRADYLWRTIHHAYAEQGRAIEDGPLPAQRHEPEWPKPLGEAAYHGPAGEVVSRLDPETESDRPATLLQFLAAAGNAIGRGPYVLVESDRHGPQLYITLVGITSKARKGTSWGLLASSWRPLRRSGRINASWAA